MGHPELLDPQFLQHDAMLYGGQGINLRSRQVIYFLAAHLDRAGPLDQVIRIDARRLLNYMNREVSHKWSDLHKILKDTFADLNKNPIYQRREGKKDFILVNWLSSLRIDEGVVTARLAPEIASYFFYREHSLYTNVIFDLRSYKSTYTARILDLLQANHRKPEGATKFSFTFSVARLRDFFSIHDDKYNRWRDFECRILQVAHDELLDNQRAPYYFAYEKIKTGRTITAIAFTVFVRPEEMQRLIPALSYAPRTAHKAQANFFDDPTLLPERKRKVLELLVELGLSEEYALNLAHQYTEPQLMGYGALVKYGVNRSLAATIVNEQCGFSEVRGIENEYINYTIQRIESQRLARQTDAAKKLKGAPRRVTPEAMRGGLAKAVFAEAQHLPAFMEALSKHRLETGVPPGSGKRGGQTQPISQVLADPKLAR